MLGVVVWSNEKRSKAVIWCEDQGALAYLAGTTNLVLQTDWPEVGDLVELECILEGGLRLARQVRLLSPGAGAALPHALRAQIGMGTDTAPERVRVQVDDDAQLGQTDTAQPANGGTGHAVGPGSRKAATANCA